MVEAYLSLLGLVGGFPFAAIKGFNVAGNLG